VGRYCGVGVSIVFGCCCCRGQQAIVDLIAISSHVSRREMPRNFKS